MINKNLKKRFYTSITLLILTLLIIKYNAALVFFLLVFGVVSLLEFMSLINKIKFNKYFFYNLFIFILFNIFFTFKFFTT